MGKGDENAGYYCLLISIFCHVSADEASLLYWYGPEHPVCQRILRKKISSEEAEKFSADMADTMACLRQKGYSIERIAEIFDCFPSTVKRRIEKSNRHNPGKDTENE